ncbi:MFS transporter [Aspergillus affinis]|uniref:MFS transporter n=1 Tax=Aspergillus affinis TaxID=1070780 RepID=UPI0022FDD46E|nr:MFS general substrate transporter [Aspergillus affinis]KAI9037602.1 MFS general substrate transporter [Aspergillus affinis]
MAAKCVRDSFIGEFLRLIGKPSWLKYDEEHPQWQSKFDCEKADDDQTIPVDWYSEDDAENPRNWSQAKKAFVPFVIGIYSFVVYMAAPIYTPSEDAFIQEFDVNKAEAALGLAIYVLGYGTGPLFFSPLSEIPRIGRNLPYAISFSLFCIISIPTSIAPNAIGFYFLRFLQGFFGSPCLATGGASIADVYSPDVLPHAMTTWVYSVFCAPAIGVLVSGFAIPVLGWRFSMWEILIAAAPVLILIFLLPETSPSTILYRRARRLEKRNSQGPYRYRSTAEIAQSNLSFHTVVRESLLIPLKITFLDPAILFLNCYTSLTYGIYYSFFEAFPIVYQEIHGFNLGEMGLAFLAIVVGTSISFLIYNLYIYKIFIPRSQAGGFKNPEDLLIPALFACFGPSIGLFLFGWSARPEVHWIVPTIGIVIYPGCVFILMQCVFLYIPACYPQYAASVFAATDFTRSAFACGAVIFSTPLYRNLGVGRGCSLLAGLTVGCVVGIYLLYNFGARLRAKSRFVSKW